MRILHVVPTYFPAVRYGGPIVSVHGLCKALARRGNDVHVFTTNVDGPNDSAVPLGVPVEMDGVKVHYFPVPGLRRLYWAPLMREALLHDIKTFDVVHTHSVFLWPTWAAARAAHQRRVPYVVSPRGMLVKDLVARRSTLIKNAWIRLVENRNVREAALIHVTSQLEAHELAKFRFNLPRVCVEPNGIDFPIPNGGVGELSPTLKALIGRSPYLLFLGRINWKKGLDRLIEMLTYLPEIRLIIAGNDEENYRPALESLATLHQVSDRVTYAGPAYGRDKNQLLSNATLMVMPSYSENFGNVALEAMAAGCPVIVTPEVGAAEIIRQTQAGLVVDGSPRALAASVAELLGDPDLLNSMRRRGPDSIARFFTWDAVAERMEVAYQSVLSPVDD